jgi:hypothetical protein
MRLFFLLGFALSFDPTRTIPKPLKQHPILKKSYPFRSSAEA